MDPINTTPNGGVKTDRILYPLALPMPALPVTPSTSTASGSSPTSQSDGTKEDASAIDIDGSDSDDENDLFADKRVANTQPTTPARTSPIDLTSTDDSPQNPTMGAERTALKAPRRRQPKDLAFDDTGSQAASPIHRRGKSSVADRSSKAPLPAKIPAPRKPSAFTSALANAEDTFKKIEQPKRAETTLVSGSYGALLAAAAVARTPAQLKADAAKARRETATKKRAFEAKHPDLPSEERNAKFDEAMWHEANRARKYPNRVAHDDEPAADKATKSAKKPATKASKGKKRAAAEIEESESGTDGDWEATTQRAIKKAKKVVDDSSQTYTVPEGQEPLPLDGDRPVVRYAVFETDFVTDEKDLKGAVTRRGEFLKKGTATKLLEKLALDLHTSRFADIANTSKTGTESNGELICTRFDLNDGTFCLFYVVEEVCLFKNISPTKYARKKLDDDFMTQYQPRWEVVSYLTQNDETRKIVPRIEGSFTTMRLANIQGIRTLAKYLMPCMNDELAEDLKEHHTNMVDVGMDGLMQAEYDVDEGLDFSHIKVEVIETQLQGPIALGEALDETWALG